MLFPVIDPVAFHLGPLAVRWYALAYLAGILLGAGVVRALHRRQPIPHFTRAAVDDLLAYAVVGIILGGRLGYVLFYNLPYFSAHPLEALKIWQGGMSFHGGMVGVAVALLAFCRKHAIPYFALMDAVSVAAPLGLCLGRVANFINGELFGRETTVPWGVVFPSGGALPRHPSQLYEAGLEGVLLFALMAALAFGTRARTRPGLLSGVFLVGYAVARTVAEQFREPDAQLGFLFGQVTMGALLSAPMLALGVFLMVRARGNRG